jgi:hypothetical protein
MIFIDRLSFTHEKGKGFKAMPKSRKRRSNARFAAKSGLKGISEKALWTCFYIGRIMSYLLYKKHSIKKRSGLMQTEHVPCYLSV